MLTLERLPHVLTYIGLQRRSVQLVQQSSGVRVDSDGASLAQIVFGEPAAEDPDHSQPCLARCLSVVGRIADHDNLRPADALEKRERSFENVRMWLRFLDVVGRCFLFYQILYAGDALVKAELVFLRLRSENNLNPILPEPLQQFAYTRKTGDPGKIPLAQNRATPRLKRVAKGVYLLV